MLTRLREKINYLTVTIKDRQNDFWLIGVCALVTLILVGGLKLYTIQHNKFTITIQKQAFTVTEKNAQKEAMLYVASKNGTKYYPVGCKAAGRIKEENKIYFATAQEAKDSGYELTSVCK